MLWARSWWRVAVVVLVGIAAHANSFGGQFLFDDIPAILSNPSVANPVGTWPAILSGNRPIALITFAANYSVSGTDPWGNHLVNLIVHLTASLVLFDRVRSPYCAIYPAIWSGFSAFRTGVTTWISM